MLILRIPIISDWLEYTREFMGEVLNAPISPWIIFIILLVIGCLLTYPLLKNINFAIPTLIGILVIAIILTIYFCNLPLPW